MNSGDIYNRPLEWKSRVICEILRKGIPSFFVFSSSFSFYSVRGRICLDGFALMLVTVGWLSSVVDLTPRSLSASSVNLNLIQDFSALSQSSFSVSFNLEFYICVYSWITSRSGA